ncbi:hypothetical protein ACFQS3_02530 [Glycomyces mayteni]|uniref:Uncharacterized protein n=1 Tax=Glycomyces mayteni TaxID=543887 RepID=A0ABW2D1Q7_9ACTN|nr:hypothetical protein GCM10025732_48040 [Glycomyces mayteni]
MKELPSTYPDAEKIGWIRSEDIEHCGLSLRMTITPGDRVVQLWELVDDWPVKWFGNAFRIHADQPGLYLNYEYSQRLTLRQKDSLARVAAKFWMS